MWKSWYVLPISIPPYQFTSTTSNKRPALPSFSQPALPLPSPLSSQPALPKQSNVASTNTANATTAKPTRSCVAQRGDNTVNGLPNVVLGNTRDARMPTTAWATIILNAFPWVRTTTGTSVAMVRRKWWIVWLEE